MRKYLLNIIVVVLVSLLMISPGWAGELDVLIDKLVEKKILTPVEAQIILSETKQDVAKQMATASLDSVPAWVQKIKMSGDLRLRYQYEKQNAGRSRNRGRLRYRLGMDANIVDSVKVGAGLASGGADPRSTNQTFENSFQHPDIRLDYAYAEWKPTIWASLVGGKFKKDNYLWAPMDYLWDTDINPEGASIHLQRDLMDNLSSYFNGGVWILDENSTSKITDPFLNYFQGGLVLNEGKFDSQLAVTKYGFNGLNSKGGCLEHSAGTNTGSIRVTDSCGGFLNSDYDALETSFEAGLSNLFAEGHPVERIAIFGDYIHNYSGGVSKDSGFGAGVKFGKKKVSDKGTWQMKYQFAQIEADAFPDIFPDSDRLGGMTDVNGHEIIFEYALNKNVIFGVDYYRSARLKNATTKENVLQADVVFKF